MASTLLRLLALAALVLMPFGMGAAVAAPAHEMSAGTMPTAGMPCSQEAPVDDREPAKSGMSCATGCAMLLAEAPLFLKPVPVLAALSDPFLADLQMGRPPEIETPPPRRS